MFARRTTMNGWVKAFLNCPKLKKAGIAYRSKTDWRRYCGGLAIADFGGEVRGCGYRLVEIGAYYVIITGSIAIV
jgi:hypothetical protein